MIREGCRKKKPLKRELIIILIIITLQVPMNRVVVGTAPSPNLTVSQARWVGVVDGIIWF